MKKNFCIFTLLTLFVTGLWAQTTVVFTGRDNIGGYVQLHHVVVENLTQQWSDTLFYPDTILIMQGVGVPAHSGAGRFSLSQNTPNPFSGVTDFSLTLPRSEQVMIEVVDLAGRRVTSLSQRLEAGGHTFRVRVNMPQQYVLTVRTPHNAASIKILNTGDGGVDRSNYLGQNGLLKYDWRDGFPHESGDMMRVTGFCQLDNGVFLSSEVLEQPLDESCTLDLVFNLFETVINDGHFVNANTFFIPDGIECHGNCICEIPLSVNLYEAGKTIQSAGDIQYVRLKMEHSYLGDLWIKLVCPNGQSATLLKEYGSGSSDSV